MQGGNEAGGGQVAGQGFGCLCLSQQMNGDTQATQLPQTLNPSAPHRYVDRVTGFLQQKLKQSQLLALKKELMVQKQQEALQEQAALEPKLDLLLEKTKELQKLVRQERQTCPGGRPPDYTERGTFASLLLPTWYHCLSDRS